MNKLLNKLKTLFNEKRYSFIAVTVGLSIGLGYIIFKQFYLDEGKAEIMLHIANTHMKNSNYELAIFGDSLNTFHDLPKELQGDSIEFLGLNELLSNPKLKGTKAGKFSNYLLGICYYNLANLTENTDTKNEYYSKAIDSFDNFKSKNKSFNSRIRENIGDVFSELGQAETAFEYYKEALENENHISKIYLLKKAAQIAKKIGKKDVALDYYQQIKNDFPNSRSAKDIDKYINELSN